MVPSNSVYHPRSLTGGGRRHLPNRRRTRRAARGDSAAGTQAAVGSLLEPDCSREERTMRSYRVIAMAALAWGLTGIGARAQTPPPPPPNAAPSTAPSSTPRHGLFRRHPKSVAGSLTPIPGGIVGNKNTHVYHLPGDQ